MTLFFDLSSFVTNHFFTANNNKFHSFYSAWLKVQFIRQKIYAIAKISFLRYYLLFIWVQTLSFLDALSCVWCEGIYTHSQLSLACYVSASCPASCTQGSSSQLRYNTNPVDRWAADLLTNHPIIRSYHLRAKPSPSWERRLICHLNCEDPKVRYLNWEALSRLRSKIITKLAQLLWLCFYGKN